MGWVPRRAKVREEPRWQERLMLERMCRLIRDGRFKRRMARKLLKTSPIDYPPGCEYILDYLERRMGKASLEEVEGLVLLLALKAGVLKIDERGPRPKG